MLAHWEIEYLKGKAAIYGSQVEGRLKHPVPSTQHPAGGLSEIQIHNLSTLSCLEVHLLDASPGHLLFHYLGLFVISHVVQYFPCQVFNNMSDINTSKIISKINVFDIIYELGTDKQLTAQQQNVSNQRNGFSTLTLWPGHVIFSIMLLILQPKLITYSVI